MVAVVLRWERRAMQEEAEEEASRQAVQAVRGSVESGTMEDAAASGKRSRGGSAEAGDALAAPAAGEEEEGGVGGRPAKQQRTGAAATAAAIGAAPLAEGLPVTAGTSVDGGEEGATEALLPSAADTAAPIAAAPLAVVASAKRLLSPAQVRAPTPRPCSAPRRCAPLPPLPPCSAPHMCMRPRYPR